jgi:hypothetical protein
MDRGVVTADDLVAPSGLKARAFQPGDGARCSSTDGA